MKLDRVFGGLNISSEGLGVQRRRMNAIAENLANADTTRTEQGGSSGTSLGELLKAQIGGGDRDRG